jgi:hypothetical protein
MDGPLSNIIENNEAVLSGFTSPGGVTRIREEAEVTVPAEIIVAATDRRLVLAPRSDSSKTVSVPYGDIATVTVEDGDVSVTTTEGTAFECELSGVEGISETAARQHLHWLGAVRSDVLGCRNDVELAAGEIERLAENLDWDEALDRYEQARSRLDEAIVRVLAADPIDATVLAPELTAAGRALERARARLSLERAESQLDLARQLLGTDAHDQCRKVLRQVQKYAALADGCGHAVQRGDRFQFGEQRALQRELDTLRWRVGAFAAELVTSAHDACVDAQDSPSRGAALTNYREALERYGHALALEAARDERQLIDTPDAVRSERDRVAAQLIDLHELSADQRWDDGVDRQEAGDQEAAIQACLGAKDHFERARDLAAAFAPDRHDSIAGRLDTVADIVAQMRTARDVSERPPESEGNHDDGTVSDLTEIDTHHDIVFKADGLTEPRSDGGEQSAAPRTNGDTEPEHEEEQASLDERLN